MNEIANLKLSEDVLKIRSIDWGHKNRCNFYIAIAEETLRDGWTEEDRTEYIRVITDLRDNFIHPVVSSWKKVYEGLGMKPIEHDGVAVIFQKPIPDFGYLEVWDVDKCVSLHRHDSNGSGVERIAARYQCDTESQIHFILTGGRFGFCFKKK